MMNCEEIRESARAGEPIPEAATEHARGCAECSETISREQKLSRLFRGLPRVTAPPAFDRTLREKIESRKAGGASLLRPGFLVPAAASLLIALAAVVGFYSLYQGPDAVGRLEVPAPAEPTRTEPAGEDVGPQDPAREPAESASEEPAGSQRIPKSGNSPVEEKRPASAPRPSGGSIDLATSEPERVLPPWMKGTVPEGKTPNPGERSFRPAEILSELGIGAVFANGGWKVESLRPQGIGARSGIRKGDVIKAIDGTELGTDEVTGGSISGTSLTVIREGKTLTVPITP